MTRSTSAVTTACGRRGFKTNCDPRINKGMSMHKLRSLVATTCGLLGLLVGCSTQSVSGGTEAVVHSGSVHLADVHVQLFDRDNRPVGFGTSGANGALELRQPSATGPLWLTPGEYRVTVESVGAVPLRFPAEYTRPESTPLIVHWSSNDQILDLDLPMPDALL
ncbi:MAG: hypothetical protein B7Z55_00955 [Planctomycetales bacterium 12-60-4]|nr:MAG: hypothetical protein B7Z55_00955 [Planctomycetales bacterium 12-60-4]